MYQILINKLIKCLVDTLIAIEFSDDTLVNDDTAVKILEQISAELQGLPEKDKNILVKELNQLSLLYPKKTSEFIKALPDTMGI